MFFLGSLHAQNNQVDLIEFVKECQILKKDQSNMSMVWWIPTEYWIESMKAANQASPEMVQAIEEGMDDYIVLAAYDAELGAMGGLTYKKNLKAEVLDKNGKRYMPISEKEVSVQAQTMISALKPQMSSIIGPMGENMEYFLFPARDDAGDQIVDVKGEGHLKVILNEKPFMWRTPLGSLVPKKKCPTDGELLSGAWSFCPWHGKKLE